MAARRLGRLFKADDRGICTLCNRRSAHLLETLAKGFRSARQRLTGVAELDDNIIDEALRDVRMSLLEGDVEFRVVKRFLDRVKEAAHGKQVELRAKSK